jgi:hypothetical protein
MVSVAWLITTTPIEPKYDELAVTKVINNVNYFRSPSQMMTPMVRISTQSTSLPSSILSKPAPISRTVSDYVINGICVMTQGGM